MGTIKRGRGHHVKQKDVDTIKKLLEKGLNTSEVVYMTGWSDDTVLKVKNGGFDRKPQKEASDQGGLTPIEELVLPKGEVNMVEADLPVFTEPPSPICQFLKDVAAALVKLADGLDVGGVSSDGRAD